MDGPFLPIHEHSTLVLLKLQLPNKPKPPDLRFKHITKSDVILLLLPIVGDLKYDRN